jgi:hypothetical protein
MPDEQTSQLYTKHMPMKFHQALRFAYEISKGILTTLRNGNLNQS